MLDGTANVIVEMLFLENDLEALSLVFVHLADA